MYPTQQPGRRVQPDLVALLMGCALFCLASWIDLIYLVRLALG
jgi:hypothetical protein